MQTFSFIVDEDVYTVVRRRLDIDAETLEEAIELVKQDDPNIYYWDSQDLYECEEAVRNSKGERVIEIMDEHYNSLYRVENDSRSI